MVAWPDLPKEAREDCFAPPSEPTMVGCLHCGQTYWSSEIRWVKEEGDEMGFWRCPVPDCSGIGFQFDIWPLNEADDGEEFGDEDWDDDEDLEDEDMEGEYDGDLFDGDDEDWNEDEEDREEKPKDKGFTRDPFLNTDNEDLPF